MEYKTKITRVTAEKVIICYKLKEFWQQYFFWVQFYKSMVTTKASLRSKQRLFRFLKWNTIELEEHP